ncbi:hypothetical protein CTA1_8559 [Colletotrichum tanaceti]|uniref:Uncharacterized protein n=1 Tax=Colletotrichum tanaceti TaxID=1306861 RepID=A0A4U6XNV6_9PEZI|nr:hypothetical protein CTA1_8559 [Colletotrichum tanaceti]
MVKYTTQPCQHPKTLQTAGSTDDTGSGEAHEILCTSQIRNRAKRIFHDLRPGISSIHGRGPQCNHAAIHVMLRSDATLDTQRGSWPVQTSLHGGFGHAILHMHRKEDRHAAPWVNDDALRHTDAAPDALPEARPVD